MSPTSDKDTFINSWFDHILDMFTLFWLKLSIPLWTSLLSSFFLVIVQLLIIGKLKGDIRVAIGMQHVCYFDTGFFLLFWKLLFPLVRIWESEPDVTSAWWNLHRKFCWSRCEASVNFWTCICVNRSQDWTGRIIPNKSITKSCHGTEFSVHMDLFQVRGFSLHYTTISVHLIMVYRGWLKSPTPVMYLQIADTFHRRDSTEKSNFKSPKKLPVNSRNHL